MYVPSYCKCLIILTFWYDVFISAETLADRVAEKIANGESMILND